MLREDDVVISGISGVFPKSNNVEEFAQKLFAKEDLLSGKPERNNFYSIHYPNRFVSKVKTE